MAIYFYDSNNPVNGSGLSEASPYNTPPGTAFGSNIWNLKAGSTWPCGAVQHTFGNNCTLQKYGLGANPRITGEGSAGTLLNGSTANNLILQSIDVVKIGTTFPNAIVVGDGGSGYQILDCNFSGGFSTLIRCSRAINLQVKRCTGIGNGSGQYGLQAIASSGTVCAGWVIEDNTFTNLADFQITASNAANSAGSYVQPVFRRHKSINGIGSTFNLVCGASAFATNPGSDDISCTSPSTLTKLGGWPAWTLGQKIVLTGFAQVANFGVRTVSSVAGNVLTVSETNIITEAAGTFKACWLDDITRGFDRPEILDSVINGAVFTPINFNGWFGGKIARNTISDCIWNGASSISAGIEIQSSQDVVVEDNRISNVQGNPTNDGMGIMCDGGARRTIVRRNLISKLKAVGTGAQSSNSSAGIAFFFAQDCTAYANISEYNYRGIWMGGAAGNGNTAYNNTLYGNFSGIVVNSSPAAGSITFSNNLILFSTTYGVEDSATSTFSTNGWFGNATLSNGGFTDATAILTNPLLTSIYRLNGVSSSAYQAGKRLGIRRDYNKNYYSNAPSLGAVEYIFVKYWG